MSDINQSEECRSAEAATFLRLDRPLQVGEANSKDLLNRNPFARSVTNVLNRVTADAGLVMSVEGAWGSGKTSLLAMIEETLTSGPVGQRPVIVHFNPWLIGSREALLGQFLSNISKAVELSDSIGIGKRVATELKTYSKVFDLLKLVPGAEPWAGLVKGVFESTGDAAGAVSEHKAIDIETRKNALETALRDFPRRIVVLIDDIDRLFPADVFEMVRIVKAVGDLPNIGYVLSWDPAYVSASLEKLDVPFASTYLDKIVQVRLAVPPLSFSLRTLLMDKFLQELPVAVSQVYFPNTEDRLAMLYHNGLSELIETPRDITRLHDVLSTIEPGLRGEIHLADVIGLACLMTKAPDVFKLLHRIPQAFVGTRPGAASFEKLADVIAEYATVRDEAFRTSALPMATRALVHWMFPLVPEAAGGPTRDAAVFTDGHIAHPRRLPIALQMSMQTADVSLVAVRQFLFAPSMRKQIVANLCEENCIDFLFSLKELASAAVADSSSDVRDMALAIALLADSKAFVDYARNRHGFFKPNPVSIALKVIDMLANDQSRDSRGILAEFLIASDALTVAARIALRSYSSSGTNEDFLVKATNTSKTEILGTFTENIQSSLRNGSFYIKHSPGLILFAANKLVPEACAEIFSLSKSVDPSCDKFIEAYLQGTWDSSNGQRYTMREICDVENFVSICDLKQLAVGRLADLNMSYPTRAAWRAVIEGGEIYGKDGSIVKAGM